MSSLVERDRIVRECWRDPRFITPDPHPDGPHYAVTVFGVIKDERLNNGKEFLDIVAWWPAAKKWTVTHQCRADEDAADYPCNVVQWQPMFRLPWE